MVALEREFVRPAVKPLALPKPTPQAPANLNSEQVPLKTWLAVVGAALGAFLAVLNIQIVNSSLADIQGAIGAGIDDGGWISTAYLVTEIIVIPLSGWLATVFSMRRYLIASTALFLAFSVACAFAHNLGEMIVLRALQGFAGGALIPLAFSIVMTSLPKSKQPIGMALYAFSAVFAPAIGPTIGGYFNENFGWQTIFFVNLVPGIAMLGMLYVSLPATKMRLDLLPGGDWAGIATMAIGLGALQTVLEEGNKNDWLGSAFIVRLSLVSLVSLALFLWIEFHVERPLINLRLLGRRNFGLGSAASFLLGIGLYGSAFVLPLYLSQLQGYNAEQIGEVLAWVGLPQLLIIPFVPLLMKSFSPKTLIGFGVVLFAISNFLNVFLSPEIAGPQLIWPNVTRAVGQAIFMTPLSAMAIGGIEIQNAGSASSLYNMMRNLGGAIGIAMLQTAITKREQFHSAILTPDVTLFDPATRAKIGGLSQYFQTHGVADPAIASRDAIVVIGRSLHRQALTVAYADAFALMGMAVVAAFVAVLCLGRARASSGAVAAH